MKKLFGVFALVSIISLAKAQGLQSFLPSGKYIGTAVNDNFFNNPSANGADYETIVKKDFNVLVAENAFKMGSILANKPADPLNLKLSDLNLSYVDKLISFTQSNNIRLRGHNFVWYAFPPSWLTTEAANWSEAQLYSFTKQYITLLAGHCKGKVAEWDVVNEAINDNSTPALRSADTWYAKATSPQAFIDSCFYYAHAADPSADLFYNDYSIETSYSNKQSSMLTVIQGMVDRGVPINGVGLQCHFESGVNTGDWVYTEVGKVMDKLGVMGLKCNVTELDLRICGSASSITEQADEYKHFVNILLTKSNCNSLLLWGFTDKSSWIPGFFSGCGEALIYDNNYQPKPAYTAMKEALQASNSVKITNANSIAAVVYPNPSTGNFMLSSSADILKISVFNVQGKEISVVENVKEGFGENFSQGIYLLKIVDVYGNERYEKIEKR
ncbi:MAG: endo-1,4-beta-xylanase [Bacteroidetes bacterium]|nr:endo-1,4-beta-xylanase [Bacteroidota bacterium]